MKRLNSDKVYKYIPKQDNSKNIDSYNENIIINDVKPIKPIKHNIDYKRKQSKNRFIYYNKHQNKLHHNTNEEKPMLPIKKCSKCNRQITDELSSFHNEEKKEDYCFDCALIEAKILLNADPKNKIMYLGAGTFGEIKEIKSEKKFMIIKRVKFAKPKYEKFSMNYLPFDQY